MSKYTINFTDGGECFDLGCFANDTEAAIHAELVIERRGHDANELVTGEWQDGRLLIWADESDAANDAGAKALCSVERQRTERDALQDWAQEHISEQLTRELADTAPCCEGWFLLVDEDGDLTGDLADAQDSRTYTACNDALGCVRLRTA